jgi:ESS family glutamate:Na+ symporter
LGAAAARWLGHDHILAGGLIPSFVLETWRGMPGVLISVVFAALFLGRRLPSPREVWVHAGAQACFGQTLAWGQYVVGIGLCMLWLTPAFGTPPIAGALIEIAFEGGHGTAAGMGPTFRALGFDAGADLALALATVGLVSGVVIGSLLVNWAARRGHLPAAPLSADRRPSVHTTGMDADTSEELRDALWEKEQSLKPTDPLSIHVAVVGLAVAIGWLVREGLLLLERLTWGAVPENRLLVYVPLFPLAMLGGVAVQAVLDRTHMGQHVNRRMMNRISGTAMDFTIVSALGTLSLAAVGDHGIPFAVLAAGGIIWNVMGVLVLAPRLFPSHWFPRAIGDFGQSTGVTVTGLLLIRMADPGNRSGAMESFGYKQLVFEPIVGGGLFTAASVPLIARFGPGAVLAITGGLVAFWLIVGWLVFGRRRSGGGVDSGRVRR